MKLSLSVLPLILIAGTLVLAAPRPKADKDDLAKFEGAWTFTSWENTGQPLNEETRKTASWSVKGDKYKFQIQGVPEEGTIKLDPSKNPAALDLSITAGNDKGKEQLGIYKIDKDAITICLNHAGGTDRPTEFKSTAENGFILVTIKRDK